MNLQENMFRNQRARYSLRVALPIAGILALVFYWYPELDIMTSDYFFHHLKTGESTELAGFWLGRNLILQRSYEAVDVLSRIALLGSVVTFLWLAARKNMRAIAALIVMLGLMVGPLLAVNGVFKEHWGRARPRDVVQFGGKQQFTPAWVIADQCQHNCAFTSGHAAAGFALCIGFFVSRRRVWLWAGVALGAATGASRIVNGAHFLSDVIFSFFIVFVCFALVTLLVTMLAMKWMNHANALSRQMNRRPNILE